MIKQFFHKKQVIHPTTHRTHTTRTHQKQNPYPTTPLARTIRQTRDSNTRAQNHPKHAQMKRQTTRVPYPSSCHHHNSTAQPRHSNRSETIRGCTISNLRKSQGVTTTSQTPTPNIAPPPSATPRNALAPARSCSAPNTISLQAIPQSHTCVAANARVSSKHSKIRNKHLTQTHPSPHASFT